MFAALGLEVRKNPDLVVNIAQLLIPDHRYQDTVTILSQVRKAVPGNANINFFLGLAYEGRITSYNVCYTKLLRKSIGQSLCRLLPKDAIVVDEAITCSQPIYTATEGAAPHDWLTLTGGAIGMGLPLSLGASVACPDRKVVALQADGSAMYTIQALWSMAREQSDITVVLLNNSSYSILNVELARVGAGMPNENTLSMFDLRNPALDWVSLSQSLGIAATRAETAGAFNRQLEKALAAEGPRLIRNNFV